MFSRLISVLLLSRCAFAQMDALTNVTNAFSMAQIVPDVVDSFTPMDLLNITFTDSVTMELINVDSGDLLTEERQYRFGARGSWRIVQIKGLFCFSRNR